MTYINGNEITNQYLKKEIGRHIDNNEAYYFEVKTIAEPNEIVYMDILVKLRVGADKDCSTECPVEISIDEMRRRTNGNPPWWYGGL